MYAWLKLIHVFAVILFLGNIITGLYWMRKAEKTNNSSIIAFTMKGIISSDRLFTIPGVIIITLGGFGAAIHGGIPLLKTGWIFWSIVLFSASGLIFTSKRIFQVTENRITGKFNNELYRESLRQWEIWGMLATITPLIALAMMVLKVPVQSVF